MLDQSPAIPKIVEIDGDEYRTLPPKTDGVEGATGIVCRGNRIRDGAEAVLHDIPPGVERDLLECLNAAIQIRARLDGALPKTLFPEFLCGERSPGTWWAANFIPGKSLEHKRIIRNRQRRIDASERVHDTAEETKGLLGSMAQWEQYGLIHRDLKPGNAIIAPTREVVVINWQLASTEERECEPEEIERNIVGTPQFLAPEVLQSHPVTRWTPKADDFAVGIMAVDGLGRITHVCPTEENESLKQRATGTYYERIKSQLDEFEKEAKKWEPWRAKQAKRINKKRRAWDPDLWARLKQVTLGLSHPDPIERLSRTTALQILTASGNISEV